MSTAIVTAFCSLMFGLANAPDGDTPDPGAVAKEIPIIVKPGHTLKVKLSSKAKGLEFTVRDHREDGANLKGLPPERTKYYWKNDGPDRVLMMIGARTTSTSARAFVRVFDSDADGAYVGWSIAGTKDSDYNDLVARISIVAPVAPAPEDTFETLTVVAHTKDENKEGKPSRPRGVSFVVYELKDGAEQKIGALDGAWATQNLDEQSTVSAVIPVRKTSSRARLRLRCSVPGDVDWRVEFVAGARSKARGDLSSNTSPVKEFEEGVSSEFTWDFTLN